MASNIAAVIPTNKAQLKTETRPIPKPGPGELVIRNHAIAANPVDWKIQAYDFFVDKYPNILGSDVSGIVESVGPNVSASKPGDRVAGFALSIATNNIDEGAFQTYTLLREQAVVKLPAALSFEDGSVYPMGVATAASGLFVQAGLELPDVQGKKKPYAGQGLALWGASSSVGVMTLQVARDLGFKVFGTASPKHHEYLRGLGLEAAVDYRDPDAVSKLVAAAKSAGVPIAVGYDAISEGESSFLTADIVAQGSGGKGGKLIVTLDLPEGREVPKGVEVAKTLAFEIFLQHEKVGRFVFGEYLKNAIERGAIKPAPKAEVVPGGLEATQKCWDQLKAGVSAKKLVIKVD